jgi:hypothetical protein
MAARRTEIKPTCHSRLFDIDKMGLEEAFGCFESF